MASMPRAHGPLMPAISAAKAGAAKISIWTTLSSPVICGPAGTCGEYTATCCRATATTRAARHTRSDRPAGARTTCQARYRGAWSLRRVRLSFDRRGSNCGRHHLSDVRVEDAGDDVGGVELFPIDDVRQRVGCRDQHIVSHHVGLGIK